MQELSVNDNNRPTNGKRRRGRRFLPDNRRRSAIIAGAVRREERQLFEEYAFSAGLTLSDWVRKVLLGYVEVNPKIAEETSVEEITP